MEGKIKKYFSIDELCYSNTAGNLTKDIFVIPSASSDKTTL